MIKKLKDIKIFGYPPLSLLLAHYDATPRLIEEVNKGTKNFVEWDRDREVSEKHRSVDIEVS